MDTYRVEDIERWRAWETASDGRRQLTWSTRGRDLRALAGLRREATDDEIAEEDQEADVRLGLTSDTWAWIRASQRESELLDATERGGLDGGRAWLERHGHGWVEARPSPIGPLPEVIQPYGWRSDPGSIIRPNDMPSGHRCL